MTAPAVWAGEDLESIVFAGEEHRPGCSYRGCGQEACYRGLFVSLHGCPHTEWQWCLPHTQATRRHAEANGYLFKCRTCPGGDWELRFIKMVPVR